MIPRRLRRLPFAAAGAVLLCVASASAHDGIPSNAGGRSAASAPFASAGDAPARFGLRAGRGTLARVGGGRFELTLHGVHRRALRVGDRAARSTPSKRVLAGWRARGYAAHRPHALLAITTGERRDRSHAVELGRPRLAAGGRSVRFRVRAVDATSSPVPDVTRPLAAGRFRSAMLLIHDDRRAATGPQCGYVAQVDLFAAASQPSAYLDADGQQLELAQYAEIYALIGSRFGGDGTRVFDLPAVPAPRGLQYRFCSAGTFPPRQPGPVAHCDPGAISLRAQDFQPAGWEPAGIAAPPGLTYYRCAGGEPAGPCVMGQLGLFTSGSMPASYLPADGRSLSIASNQPLFFILETTFGGDDHSFDLPDLRGPVPGTSYGVCAAGRWPS